MLLDGVRSISDAVARLKRNGHERDYMVVDTPNAFVDIIRDAISAADRVILPVEASPIDILVNKDVVAEVDALGKRDASLYVVNPAEGRSEITTETLLLLKPLSPNSPTKVGMRVAYRRALINGQAGTEINSDARQEILSLLDKIHEVMRKSDGHESRKDVGIWNPNSQAALKRQTNTLVQSCPTGMSAAVLAAAIKSRFAAPQLTAPCCKGCPTRSTARSQPRCRRACTRSISN